MGCGYPAAAVSGCHRPLPTTRTRGPLDPALLSYPDTEKRPPVCPHLPFPSMNPIETTSVILIALTKGAQRHRRGSVLQPRRQAAGQHFSGRDCEVMGYRDGSRVAHPPGTHRRCHERLLQSRRQSTREHVLRRDGSCLGCNTVARVAPGQTRASPAVKTRDDHVRMITAMRGSHLCPDRPR